MRQRSFADLGFAGAKPTRREVFLAEMEKVVPWGKLLALIAPVYPKAGNGRHPYSLELMLRIHCAQLWFNLADRATEEALYDSRALCRFVGLDPLRDRVPDETTILHFRRLLETHSLTEAILKAVNEHLAAAGLSLRSGTLVDATLIAAPSSTKNREKKRDPEMRQTKKGQQWYFGMKSHIGVDAQSGLVHSVLSTDAAVADMRVFEPLLHGEEPFIAADRGYDYPAVHDAICERHALDAVALKSLPGEKPSAALKGFNRAVASLRAKVEHSFRIIKRQFGFTKVRMRGIAKNHSHLTMLFALANLYQARRWLLEQQG